MLSFSPIEKPKIDIELYGTDINIAPIDKVHIMDEDSFEHFTLEWLYGCKKDKYSSIMRIGGAGDKGRDVIAYRKDGGVDYFQCKHYNSALAPSNYYLELGKLCYYTYTKDIPLPKSYYIVASNDIGPTLQDLLDNSAQLLSSLLDNWDTYCRFKITKSKEINLDADLLGYIRSFDFSIIKTYPIAQIIDEHLNTVYGSIRFGTRTPTLPAPLSPSAEIDPEEMEYVSALLAAYSEELGMIIDTPKALEAYERFFSHFNRQRKDYYSAETIRRFVRDSMAFFIEKIVASGAGKKESTIVFKPGANIIYGPSNTGKTYIVKCIDFLFGSDADPFDSSSGYDSISIYLKTRGGQVVMHRKLGSNKIDVSSTDPSISNGKYTAKASGKNYEKTINSVWLALIGITEQHSINKNERSQKQVLSWRTFCHMFMLTETKIISETSIFLPDRGYSDTSALSALLFLLWGKDFSDTEAIESKEIKDAKKDAIKTYINQELFKISERNQELTAFLSELSTTDINQEIESLMTQVTENEQRISEAIDENKRILQSLHEKNDALSECNVLINRYQELTTQYGADLKRLSFIVDGTANMPQISETQCPFCDGKIRIEKTPNYIEAAKSDYKKIKLQAKDLQKAYDELLAEKDILESSIESLLAKKQSAEELVANKLTPKANQLKEKIAEYKKTLEYQNEISFLKKLVEQKTSDIIDTESLGESENKFKVKDYFDYSFVSEFGKWIKLFLEDCKYPNLTSLIFDKATMDIVLNGKKKSANGKGYNAYLNSAVAIVLSRYMQKHAHYAPGLILLDSPILSLKEIDTQKPSQSMRNGLFENIASTSEGIQTIVIENEIPEIDYSNVNLIHFTKNANTGRYGFLIDVMD